MTKLNLKSASQGLYHHSYKPSSIVSMDISQLNCVKIIEVNPRDKFTKIHGDGFLRLAPQVFPPYGKCYIKTAAFFVPSYQLLEYADAFHQNMNQYKSKACILPRMRAYDINRLFSLDSVIGASLQLSTLVDSSTNPVDDRDLPSVNEFDFHNVVEDPDNAGAPLFNYYKLNERGRYFYKVLKTLGYEFVSFEYRSTYINTIKTADYYVNVMPLLAYTKVYVDMFVNGNFYNTSTVVALLNAIHSGESYIVGTDYAYTYSSGILSLFGLALIFTHVLLPHEQNMYTEAWNSANSPDGTSPQLRMLGTQPSGLVSPYIDMDAGSLQSLSTSNRLDLDGGVTHITSNIAADGSLRLKKTGREGAPASGDNFDRLFTSSAYNSQTFQYDNGFVNGKNDSVPASEMMQYYSGLKVNNITQAQTPSLSAFGLRVFEALDRFVQRNNLAGSKAVQRLYARFGIKSDDFNAHFVHKLFENSEKIDFHPVMSNADTVSTGNGKALGSYAGFAASGLNIDFNYQSNDYGYIIVLSWIQIVPLLMRGFDPSTLRLNPQDFWTPEFDGQTVRAIPKCEVSVNRLGNGEETDDNTDSSVYGFTNLYDDYRNLKDTIAGDFINENFKSFMFARDLSVIRESGHTTLKPQLDAVQYYDQYDNPDMTDPFLFSKEDGDRFYLEIDWDIEAQRPIRSASDTFNLGGTGDIEIAKNGVMMN